MCHGVESKHKDFKMDLKVTMGNTWVSEGWVGFPQCLDFDRSSWSLRALGVGQTPRYKVGRTQAHKEVYRAYHVDIAGATGVVNHFSPPAAWRPA